MLKSTKLFITVAAMLLASVAGVSAANPKANSEAVVRTGDMRFTVLTPEMIRIEWRSGADKSFVDNATFSVINRELPVPDFNVTDEGDFLVIKTSKLTLKYRKGSYPATFPASSANLSITFSLNGRDVVWYPGKTDALNLKGTCRTLDLQSGDNKRDELEDGLISRSGWAVIDDTGTRGDGSKSLLLEPNSYTGFDWVTTRSDKDALDWYFMGYGHDYKKALADFTLIAGKIPMPPMYAFGYWYSKYERYNDRDFMQLVDEMEENDVPIDVMVIDTDWHINGWTGWTWNRDLFPSPNTFLKWLHDKNLKVTLNLHPAYGVENNEENFQAFVSEMGLPSETESVEWQLENPRFYKALFNNILRPHENAGVDFWWLDWQQWLLSDKVEGLGQTFWLNYVFYNDMAQAHPDRRAMIFHRWGGLGNHRYPLGFSGDSYTSYATLGFQQYFTATASNVGYGYWGHDLGGHLQEGPNNAELYLRWIQFGAFSPIFRSHSMANTSIERRIWKYSNFDLMKEAFELRYAMIPYIYNNARTAYDTGISLCRPLYYDYPEEDEAYMHEGEYMFGDDMLVNPITKPARTPDRSIDWSTWLPEGLWWNVCADNLVQGNSTVTEQYGQGDIPVFYRAGAVIPNYPKVSNLKTRPDRLILKLVPGADGEMSFYEDANDTEDYKNGEYARTLITQKRTDKDVTCHIGAIEGDFKGKPTQRRYTVCVMGMEAPEAVSKDGVTMKKASKEGAEGWTYDAETHTVYVNLPLGSTAVPTEIKVTAKQNVLASSINSEFDIRYNRSAKLLTVVSDADFEYTIFDVSGRSMAAGHAVGSTEVSAIDYPTGMYLCKVCSESSSVIYKFVR